MPIVYEKATGKKIWHIYAIDCREMVAAGTHTYDPPSDSEDEKVELDGAQIQEVADIAERARLGEVIVPEDREKLNEWQSAMELDYPGSPPVAPAPESTPVVDTFDPATAERPALFGYLRDKGVEVGNAASTAHLREKVYESMSESKSD